MRHRRLAIALVLSAYAATATASFHDWDVSEVFTNADRSVQFIEFFTTSSGQQEVGNHFVETFSDGAMQARFVIPPGGLDVPPGTAGRFFVIATPAFAAAAGIDPDYELPAPGFIAANVDFVALIGADAMSIGQPPLPTDGFSSLNEDFSQPGENLLVAAATPTNFAGEVGQIVPEPGAALAAVVAYMCLASLNWRASPRSG